MSAGLPRRAVLRAALLLALCAALPFARVVFGGHVLFERDIQAVRWGQLEAFARCLAAGSWPLWNTLDGLGRPMLANPGSQVLYPFTWLSLALAPQDYYDLYAFAHVLLAGLGAFVLARRLGVSAGGGLLAGSLFLLGGPLLSVTNLWQHLAGAAWVPWVLAAGDTALERPTVGRAVAWGGAVALQVLTGSLDYVLLGGLAQAALALRHLAPPGARWRGTGPRLAAGAGAAALALGLSAAQWVPALDLLHGAWRAELGESARLLWSLHPALLLQALAPVFPHDLPLTTVARQAVYDGREPLLSSIYLGAAALPFAVAGTLARPRRTPGILLALGLLATALALGRHGLAYFWALDLVPALDVFRFPVKTLVLAALAYALLAGLGFDAWASASRGVRAAAGGVTLAAALGLALAWVLGAGWSAGWLAPDPVGRAAESLLAPVLAPLLPTAILAAGGALALLARPGAGRVVAACAVAAAGELALAHRDVLPSLPRAFFAPTPGLVAAAKADGVERLQSFDYLQRRKGRTGPSWKADEPAAFLALPRARRLAMQGQEYPLDGSRWGVRGGIGSDVAGLESRARLALTLLVRYHQEDGPRLARLLRLGGITHLAARHREGLEAFPLRAEVRTVNLGDAFLLRVEAPLPRAYAVEGVRVASGRAVYPVWLDDAFDPAREVVLPAGAARPAAPGFASEVHVVEDRPDRILVEARLSRAGQLVVLEGFDRGWRASVDGRATGLQEANGLFLSVPLEPGHHRVELLYRPPSVGLGLAVTAATALAALALVGGRREQRRRAREGTS